MGLGKGKEGAAGGEVISVVAGGQGGLRGGSRQGAGGRPDVRALVALR